MDEEDRPGITPLMEVGKKSLRIGNQHVRGAIGEFFGTLIVGFMCVGAGVQATVNSTETALVPVLGIILGIMTAIIITGGVSGGHVNPAVSISLAVAGELSWYSLPGYLFSQFLGAMLGALMAWGLLLPTLRFKLALPMDIPQFDMNNHSYQIAGVFSPLKTPGCTVFNGLCSEMVLTCFLIMALCAVLDKQNGIKPPGYLVPLMIPLVIASFCFTFELPSGTLLNPARDVGPRFAAVILGWSWEYVFMSKDYGGNLQHWWVVGLVGPIIGGILGALIYSFVIGPQVNTDHLPPPPLPPMPFFMHPRDPIRHVLDAKSAASGAGNGDWRNTTFVPKGLPIPASNSNPFSVGSATYANTNNNDARSFLSEAYQQQAQQQQAASLPSVYYQNHPYVKGW